MKALKIVLAAAILLAGVLALNACQAIQSPFEGYNWNLVSRMEGGANIFPLEGTVISVFFDSKTLKFSGSSGCNQYSGTYKVDGLTISIDATIITTKIACSPERNEQERKYLEALKLAGSFKMDHGNLVIYCDKQIMTFKRDNSTQTPTEWGQ
jgi:heat shock protein HslJ